jgi:endogenous inhibitor of DNA gyrase (YacG/DUF329 family)
MSDKPATKSECVICRKPQDPRYRPFCSKRCADVDLNRWFSGAYAIPAEEEREPSAGDPPEEKS